VTFVLSGIGSQLAALDNNTLTLGPTTVVRSTSVGAALTAGRVWLSSGSTIINFGTIEVQQGMLSLDVDLVSSFTNRGVIRVDAGATLDARTIATGTGLRSDGGTVRGGGLIRGSVAFVGTGNELRPGADAAPGTLTVSGDLTLNAGSTLFARLNGLAAGTGYDQLVMNGEVDLGGAVLSALLGGGYSPAAGNELFVLTNDGIDPITGTFAGLPNGATVPLGDYSASISYFGDVGSMAVTGGNDVVLFNFTPVPEPSTALTVAATLAVAAGWRLRRWSQNLHVGTACSRS
jgi:hypothetical protein